MHPGSRPPRFLRYHELKANGYTPFTQAAPRPAREGRPISQASTSRSEHRRLARGRAARARRGAHQRARSDCLIVEGSEDLPGGAPYPDPVCEDGARYSGDRAEPLALGNGELELRSLAADANQAHQRARDAASEALAWCNSGRASSDRGQSAGRARAVGTLAGRQFRRPRANGPALHAAGPRGPEARR